MNTTPAPTSNRRFLTSRLRAVILTIALYGALSLCGSAASESAPQATYHSFSNSNTVSRLNGDGEVHYSFPLPTIGSFTQPSGIAVDPIAKKLYYTRINFIGSVNLDGTGNTTVIDFGAGNAPLHLEIDAENGHLYIYFNGSHMGIARGIYRMNTDGGGLIPIITGLRLSTISPDHDPLVVPDGQDGLVLDLTGGGRIYWSDHRRLMRAKLDGSDAELVSLLPFNISGFDIHGGKIYYSNSTSIQRANLDGTDTESVWAPGFGFPRALEVDADRDRLYFHHADAVKYLRIGDSYDTSLDPVEVRRVGSSGAAKDIEVGPLPALTEPKIVSVSTVRIAQKPRFKIDHTTDPGIQYTVQSSTDMSAGSWKSTGITVIGDGGIKASNFPYDALRKFFRVVREDPSE